MPTLRLCLKGHDEIFMIDLDRVVYIQADDHYSFVHYSPGVKFMVPFGLSRIEALLAEMDEDVSFIQRFGRKNIVNTRRIFRVNTIKEDVSLCDDTGATMTIHVPKAVLRQWIDSLADKGFDDDADT